MALCDYILCKNCECKLIPDGYDLIRDHLEEKWGNPEVDDYTPMLLCPDCVATLEREVEPWIPVNERLPEPHEIIRFYPPINEGTAYSVDWGWFEGGQCLYQEYDDRHGSLTRVHVNVTHWQPITEPEEPGHD